MTAAASSAGAADAAAPPAGGRRPLLPAWLPFALQALFVAALFVQERALLTALCDGQPLPAASWRLLWPLALLACALALPPRLTWLFLAASGAASALILAADAAYQEYFGSVVSLTALPAVSQLWDVRSSVRQLVSPAQLAAAAAFLALVLHGAWGRGRVAPLPPGRLSRLLRPRRLSAALLVTIGLLFLRAWTKPIHEETHQLNRPDWVLPKDHWRSQFSDAAFAATFGVFNFHVRDAARNVASRFERREPTPKRRAEIAAVLEERRRLNALPTPLRGAAAGRDVVLIQLEAFQHLLLGAVVDGVEVTPTLNRLRREAFSTDCLMDVTWTGRTSDAEFAVLTGLLPDTRRPAAFLDLSCCPLSLPQEVEKAGYRTASFHGYDIEFWNRQVSHAVFGFDEKRFRSPDDPTPALGLGTSDRLELAQVALYLDERRDGLDFVLAITLTSHHPYAAAPPEQVERFARLDPRRGYGLFPYYLASVRYADDALGAFFDDLARRGLLERTLFVVYGDHDMGAMSAQRAPDELGGSAVFSRNEDRVPLLVWLPGREDLVDAHGAELRTATAGLHDVMPTVLHLVGLDAPLGVQGLHVFLPQDLRPPIPMPGMHGTVAYRATLGAGGASVPLVPGAPAHEPMPTYEAAFAEQQLVRDLVDSRLLRDLAAP